MSQEIGALEIAKLCRELALEKKAEDPLILEITKLSSIADYFVICSAKSERQVSAIARIVSQGAKDAGATILGQEGLSDGEWALIDMGDVVFHIFLDTARLYYDLEGFWSDAPVIS